MYIVQPNGNTPSTSPGRSLHRLPNRRAKVFPAPNCLRSTPHNVSLACHSGTVLRASLLSDFHIQRCCQWYGCSTAYCDKVRRGFGKFKQVSGKVWRFTLFQFDKLPGKHCFSSLCLALHGKLCFSLGHRDGRGAETGCVSETASASLLKIH